MSKSREQLNKWLSGIMVIGGSLLDVGVQDKPVKDKLSICTPENYHTLDIDDQWEPDIIGDLNLPIFDGLSELAIGYDTVFAIEVFEHLWNPVQALKNLNEIMNKEGVLYVSFPFINPLHDYFDSCRYTEEGFTKMLEATGFRVDEVDYRRATVGKDLLFSFYKTEGMKISRIRYAEIMSKLDIIGFMFKAVKI